MGNQPSSVPFGSSINLLNTTLKCTQTHSNTNTSITLPFVISATAPLYVGFAQPYYYGDLKVAMGVPYQLAYDQREYGTYYQVNVSTTLDVPAGVPGNTQGAPFTISAGMLRNWTQYEANIPSDATAVLPPQGPVSTLYYEAPYSLDLKVKSVKMVFQNLLGNLQPIDSPYIITCGNQGFDYIVASTQSYTQNVNTYSLAPANGYQATFPLTASGRKTSIANLPVDCSFNGETQFNFNLTIGGQAPAAVSAGSDISLSNFNTFLTVPPEVITRLSSDNPGLAGHTYRLQFNVGKDQNNYDLVPGIGLNYTGSQTAYQDLARDFTDDKDPLPPSTARNVDYSFKGQETFALPLVSSLSSVLQSTTGYFGVAMNVFQGELVDFAPADDYYPYFTTICKPGKAVYQHQFLKAPIY